MDIRGLALEGSILLVSGLVAGVVAYAIFGISRNAGKARAFLAAGGAVIAFSVAYVVIAAVAFVIVVGVSFLQEVPGPTVYVTPAPPKQTLALAPSDAGSLRATRLSDGVEFPDPREGAPRLLAGANDGGLWFVTGDAQLQHLAPGGALTRYALDPSFGRVSAIAADSAGNIWLSNSRDWGTVERVDVRGDGVAFSNTMLSYSGEFAFAADGAVWVANSGGDGFSRISRSGQLTIYMLADNGSTVGHPEDVRICSNTSNMTLGVSSPSFVALGGDGSTYYDGGEYVDGIGWFDPISKTCGADRLNKLKVRGLARATDGTIWLLGYRYAPGNEAHRDPQKGVILWSEKTWFVGWLGADRSLHEIALPPDADPMRYHALAAGASGKMWFLDDKVGLKYATRNGRLSDTAIPGAGTVSLIASSPNGSLWAQVDGGLVRLDR